MCNFPIRCFSCGKVIGNQWQTYQKHLEKGLSKENALNTIGMRRYCCRRMFLGHVELVDQLILYSEDGENANSKVGTTKSEI